MNPKKKDADQEKSEEEELVDWMKTFCKKVKNIFGVRVGYKNSPRGSLFCITRLVSLVMANSGPEGWILIGLDENIL